MIDPYWLLVFIKGAVLLVLGIAAAAWLDARAARRSLERRAER